MPGTRKHLLLTVRRVEAVCLDGWRGVTRAKEKEGYYYETDDFHASPVSAQMKPCDQDWGKENLDVSGAVPLPENNCIIPYMWYPVNEKTQYIVSKL